MSTTEELNKMAADFDWAKLEGLAEDECTCQRCGTLFKSHARYFALVSALLSQKPCPKCGEHTLGRVMGENALIEV